MHESFTDRPRLLLLAFSCNPRGGSELGLGWNRALEAAKYFPTWVLCDDDANRRDIEQYLARHGAIANLEFVFVRAGRTARLFRQLPGMYYPAYNLWHRRAFKVATELHRRLRFDLVHQLNLCGYREPGYLWKLDAPLVWGPIGGSQNYPWQFLTQAGIAGATSEAIRSVLNNAQIRWSRRVGQAARAAHALLAANTTNALAIAPRCNKPPRVTLETGVHVPDDPPQHDFRHSGPLRILWSGVFEHRKALQLLFAALAELPPEVQYELHILGRGPLEKRWRRIARRLNIERHCRWLGWLDHPQALEQYAWADAFVFSSLRDTTGNVVLESLANGTPVLCLDHQGMADIVTEDCGVKIPVTGPHEVVCRLRDTLLRWHGDRSELERLSQGARRRADYYSWRRQGQRMAKVYHEVLSLADRSMMSTEIDRDAAGSTPSADELALAIAGTAGKPRRE